MGYNEEELLYLSRQGCTIASEQLAKWCRSYVERTLYNLSVYPQSNYDYYDIIQCSWIACMKAIEQYRPDRQCRLKTYLTTVIKNQTATIIRKVCIEKERYYDRSISLDEENKSGYVYGEVIANEKDSYHPSKTLFIKETKRQYGDVVQDNCSGFEKEVVNLKILGYTPLEIASILKVDIKSIYNAIYRIQKKLEPYKSI